MALVGPTVITSMWLSSVRSVLPLSAAPASLLTNSGVVSRALAATTSWSSMSCSAAKGHAGSPGLYRRYMGFAPHTSPV